MNTDLSIDDFCDLILESWGEFRDHERVINGVRSNFRHLIDEELQELWRFIKKNPDKIKIPSASNIRKAAKEERYRIREPATESLKSIYVCGQCGYDGPENGILKRNCHECGKHFSDLPAKCGNGHVFPENHGYASCKYPIKKNGDTVLQVCNLPRIPGAVKRVIG